MSDAAEDGIERTTKKKTNIEPTRRGYKCGQLNHIDALHHRCSHDKAYFSAMPADSATYHSMESSRAMK